ncbi:MAG: hypothetical protein L0I32_08555 [Lactobacillus sp.]|nr:hypothetical protein [Lactobacillus sp.]
MSNSAATTSDKKTIANKDRIILDLSNKFKVDDAVLRSLEIEGISARAPYVNLISKGMKPVEKFELYTDFLEFYRNLKHKFTRMGFKQDFILFEEDKVMETGPVPNLILNQYFEDSLITTLVDRDYNNLEAAILNSHGEDYSGFAILGDFMERTIGYRSTFFDLRKAYEKVQFGFNVNNVDAINTHIRNIEIAQKWYTIDAELTDRQIAQIIAENISYETKRKMIEWAMLELHKHYESDQFHIMFKTTKELLNFINSYCKKAYKKKFTIYALEAREEARISEYGPPIDSLTTAGTDNNRDQQGIF